MVCTGHTHRIAIVDDDAAVRDSLALLLESYGYAAAAFGSVDEYLRQPGESCLLLVDQGMAGMSGVEFVQLLRAAGLRTPILLMTDVAEARVVAQIDRAEGCLAVARPINAVVLLERIADAIRTAESRAYGTSRTRSREFSRVPQ